MKLTAKLVMILVLAITILFALDGYLAVRREVQRFEDYRRLSAQLLGYTLQYLAQAGQTRRVFALIQEVNRQQSAVRVRWLWVDTAPDNSELSNANEKARAAILDGNVVSLHRIDPSGRGWLCTYVRVTAPGQRPGVLEISEPWPHPGQQTSTLAVHILTMTALMVLVGGIAVYVLGTEMVGRPLARLIEKTRRVGKGDLSGPLRLRGRDELSELAEALNTMCGQLAESRDKTREEQAARMAALEQLRHADRLRTVGGLASGMAHELGTPLNVISGRAGLIAAGKLSPEEIAGSARTIKDESQRMAAILRQLLDFARRSSPQKTRVDLRQIASQTRTLLQALARKQNVSIELAAPDQPVTAWVDPGQIQQVLTNLIVNAIQSMPDGGLIKVGIQRQQTRPSANQGDTTETFVRVDVRDQGVGISAEDREHLFEPFFTTKDVGEGTGLGLSIAYGIVQEHGGWIDVQSEPGNGSCFSIYLPEETDS